MLGSGPILKAFLFCQPEKISVSSSWDLLLRICNIVKKNKHGSRKNRGCKKWLKLKSVYNILVFLGFANFYWQFIQDFNKIVVLFLSMLKTTRLPDKLAPSKNNGSKSVSSRNDKNKLAFERNNGNNEVNRFDIGRNSMEHAKKSGKSSKSEKLKSKKLSKSWKPSKLGKSKSEKMSKSQNLAKSEKNLSKCGNSTNFDTMEDKPKFLTSDARIAFNCL